MALTLTGCHEEQPISSPPCLVLLQQQIIRRSADDAEAQSAHASMAEGTKKAAMSPQHLQQCPRRKSRWWRSWASFLCGATKARSGLLSGGTVRQARSHDAEDCTHRQTEVLGSSVRVLQQESRRFARFCIFPWQADSEGYSHSPPRLGTSWHAP